MRSPTFLPTLVALTSTVSTVVANFNSIGQWAVIPGFRNAGGTTKEVSSNACINKCTASSCTYADFNTADGTCLLHNDVAYFSTFVPAVSWQHYIRAECDHLHFNDSGNLIGGLHRRRRNAKRNSDNIYPCYQYDPSTFPVSLVPTTTTTTTTTAAPTTTTPAASPRIYATYDGTRVTAGTRNYSGYQANVAACALFCDSLSCKYLDYNTVTHECFAHSDSDIFGNGADNLYIVDPQFQHLVPGTCAQYVSQAGTLASNPCYQTPGNGPPAKTTTTTTVTVTTTVAPTTTTVAPTTTTTTTTTSPSATPTGVAGCAPIGWSGNGSGNDGYTCDPTGATLPYSADKLTDSNGSWKYFGVNYGWQPEESWNVPSASWIPPPQWTSAEALKATWWSPGAFWLYPRAWQSTPLLPLWKSLDPNYIDPYAISTSSAATTTAPKTTTTTTTTTKSTTTTISMATASATPSSATSCASGATPLGVALFYNYQSTLNSLDAVGSPSVEDCSSKCFAVNCHAFDYWTENGSGQCGLQVIGSGYEGMRPAAGVIHGIPGRCSTLASTACGSNSAFVQACQDINACPGTSSSAQQRLVRKARHVGQH